MNLSVGLVLSSSSLYFEQLNDLAERLFKSAFEILADQSTILTFINIVKNLAGMLVSLLCVLDVVRSHHKLTNLVDRQCQFWHF